MNYGQVWALCFWGFIILLLLGVGSATYMGV